MHEAQDLPPAFHIGFLLGALVGEGHFGGDARQPQITLKLHMRWRPWFIKQTPMQCFTRNSPVKQYPAPAGKSQARKPRLPASASQSETPMPKSPARRHRKRKRRCATFDLARCFTRNSPVKQCGRQAGRGAVEPRLPAVLHKENPDAENPCATFNLAQCFTRNSPVKQQLAACA